MLLEDLPAFTAEFVLVPHMPLKPWYKGITTLAAGGSTIWAYIGCFRNDRNRVRGHIAPRTWEECKENAESREDEFFGMEYPQGYRGAGDAQCVPTGDLYLRLERVDDSDCLVEVDSEGRALGGAWRVAVYGETLENDGTLNWDGTDWTQRSDVLPPVVDGGLVSFVGDGVP